MKGDTVQPIENSSGGEVIDAFEVARMLGVHSNTVYEQAKRGYLPHRRLGRKILFSRSAILRWIACDQKTT